MSEYDVFISHAWEDKQLFVRDLATRLHSEGVVVWYDEFALKAGDSLRSSIDLGVAGSRFGIVVLSPDFFKKSWTRRELDGLTALQMADGRRLLPIWHGVTKQDVLKYSPSLADLVAIHSSAGMDRVVADILKVVKPGNAGAAGTQEVPHVEYPAIEQRTPQAQFRQITKSVARARTDMSARLQSGGYHFFHVWGPEGIGKSTLLAEFENVAKNDHFAIVARLDSSGLHADPNSRLPDTIRIIEGVARQLEYYGLKLAGFRRIFAEYQDALAWLEASNKTYLRLHRSAVEITGAAERPSTQCLPQRLFEGVSENQSALLCDPVGAFCLAIMSAAAVSTRPVVFLVDDVELIPTRTLARLRCFFENCDEEAAKSAICLVVTSESGQYGCGTGIELVGFEELELRTIVEQNCLNIPWKTLGPPAPGPDRHFNPALAGVWTRLLTQQRQQVPGGHRTGTLVDQIVAIAESGAAEISSPGIGFAYLATLRSFDIDAMRVVCDCDEIRARVLLDEVGRLGFVRELGEGLRFQEDARGLLLQKVDRAKTKALHGKLGAHYTRLSRAESAPQRRSTLELEAAYHETSRAALSNSTGECLAIALSAYLEALPGAWLRTTDYSRMYRQIIRERERDSARELLDGLGDLASALDREETEQPFELVAGVESTFSAIARRIPILRITEDDVDDWVQYLAHGNEVVEGLLKSRESRKRPNGGTLDFCLTMDASELAGVSGDVGLAVARSEHAMALAREGLEKALAHLRRGTNYKRIGAYQSAIVSLREARKEFGDSGRSVYIGQTLVELGNTYVCLREIPAAVAAFDEAMVHLDPESPVDAAVCQHRLGWAYRVAGEHRKALDKHTEGERRLRLAGTSKPLGKLLHSKGNVLVALGEYRDASDAFKEALAIFQTGKMSRHRVLAQADSAEAEFREGRPAVARTAVKNAIEWHRSRVDDREYSTYAEALGVKASLALRVGSMQEALEAWLGARDMAYASRDEYLLAKINADGALLSLFLRSGNDRIGFPPYKPSPLETLEESLRPNTRLSKELGKSVRSLRRGLNILLAAERLDAQGAVEVTEEQVRKLLDVRDGPFDDMATTLFADLVLSAMLRQRGRICDRRMVEAYDENGDAIGVITELQAHVTGLRHRSVEIWVTRKAAVRSGGRRHTIQVLLRKQVGGLFGSSGKFTASAAGHVLDKEGLEDACNRVLSEHLGFNAPTSLRLLHSVWLEPPKQVRVDREQISVYALAMSEAMPVSCSGAQANALCWVNAAEAVQLLERQRDRILGRGHDLDSRGESVEGEMRIVRDDFDEWRLAHVKAALGKLTSGKGGRR